MYLSQSLFFVFVVFFVIFFVLAITIFLLFFPLFLFLLLLKLLADPFHLFEPDNDLRVGFTSLFVPPLGMPVAIANEAESAVTLRHFLVVFQLGMESLVLLLVVVGSGLGGLVAELAVVALVGPLVEPEDRLLLLLVHFKFIIILIEQIKCELRTLYIGFNHHIDS